MIGKLEVDDMSRSEVQIPNKMHKAGDSKLFFLSVLSIEIQKEDKISGKQIRKR